MHDAVKKFFKRNTFLKPLCIIAFTLLILTDQQTGITTVIVVAFSVLLLIEGVLALKFTKPDFENALQKIQESELTTEEKARRQEALKKTNTVSSVFNIAIAVTVIVVWFFVL